MKSTNIFIAIFMLLLTITFNGCLKNQNQPQQKSETEKSVLNLSGRWKFSIGDDNKWKEKSFNDNSWEEINVPSSWENQGFQGYDGYAWYRKSFKLTQDISKKNLYLVLGYVDDVDQTYINGNLIGISGSFPNGNRTFTNGKLIGYSDGFRNDYQTAYSAFRKYYIPKEYLNENGGNVIAVRVFDDELDGGIMSGKVGLYTYDGGFEPDVNLNGIWEFKTGDDSSFIKSNNADVNSVNLMVPALWDIQGYRDYDGFGWYRKTFFLPKEFEGEGMILMLGRIDDIDQTFVNGKIVGSTGIWNFQDTPTDFNKNEEYRENRVYSVPEKFLKFGEANTIAVRVYDGFQFGGIYEGLVGLIKQSNYKKYFSKNKN